MLKPIQIAVDGPAGAGKSTAAKLLADKLKYIYIDTGAMYRAITYKILWSHINIENEEEIINLAEKTKLCFVKGKSNEQRVLCDNEDITEEIRTPNVTKFVSSIAKISRIREYLVKIQQQIADNNNVIMDGRDIGTVVLPSAQIKFFITASLEERAKRRVLQLQNEGVSADFSEVYNLIKERDKIDSEREIAPLKPAEDAIIINTTNLSLQEVVENMQKIILEEINNGL